MSQSEEKNNQWFGPKSVGWGITPRSWQGWLSLVIAVLAEVLVASRAPYLWSSWFVAKTNGSVGWKPVTWQGWTITLAPVAVFLIFATYIYNKQRKV